MHCGSLCMCVTAMDQEVARRLFAEGAALVLLDVPERTEVGIDYNCWSVGPRFKGIKMIPPGFHFVFYSAVSRQGQSAPRTGFFHCFKRQELLVRRWDPYTEDLTDEGISHEDAERIRIGLKDLDRSLGAYPYDSLKKWVSLTNHITEDLVARVQPTSGKVSSVTQLQPEELSPPSMSLSSNDSGQPTDQHSVSEGGGGEGGGGEGGGGEGGGQGGSDDAQSQCTPGGVFAGVGEFPPTVKERIGSRHQLPELKYKAEAALRFSAIPSHKYPEGSTPSQVTHYHLDLSYTLDTMLRTQYNNRDQELLGELQLTFICFLVGHVYDAFEHWKNLVKLLCSCEEALSTHKELFSSFISMLHFQLKEIPEDFFVDIVSKNNFLTVVLQTFFSNLEESTTADKALVKRGLQFRENLTKKYKWDFSSEPEDYAPTIVET